MRILWIFLICYSFISFAAGDYQAGAEKSASCAACHGKDGVSINDLWPNLAGQHAKYLAKQLHDFAAKGSRDSVIMQPLAATLTDQDIENLAVFYAQQTVATGKTPQKYLSRGELLYRGGDFSKQISACIACHGPDGKGNGQAGFPDLSGQHPGYVVQQLQLFATDKRKNDLMSIMRDISKRMSNEDMEAVAYYVAGLH